MGTLYNLCISSIIFLRTYIHNIVYIIRSVNMFNLCFGFDLAWFGKFVQTRARARVCVSVCLCVYVHPPWRLHLSGTAGNASELINDVVLKLAALSCSCTGSGHSHDLTSIRLACRTQGLHSPLTGFAFGIYYIVSRSGFASALARGFAIYLGKAKVPANFSIEPSPRQSP